MIPDFNQRFDQAYSAQLYRRFCTEADQQLYRERYLGDPASDATDLQQEAIEVYTDSEPF